MLLGRAWGALGALWVRSGALLRCYWGALGALWGVLGALLGRSWGALGVLGRSWGALGVLWGRLGVLLGRFLFDFEAIWGQFWVEFLSIPPFSLDALSVPPLGQV